MEGSYRNGREELCDDLFEHHVGEEVLCVEGAVSMILHGLGSRVIVTSQRIGPGDQSHRPTAASPVLDRLYGRVIPVRSIVNETQLQGNIRTKLQTELDL